MRPIFLFFALFFLIGCGKDGEVGPQGEQGIQGEKGISGANGNTIYSGKSAPSLSIGKNGDFFLNIANGDLYGPKTNDSWGQPFNLKGPQGENGAPGATILSGAGIPLVTAGKNGDFYINLKEMTMYGPKTQTGWGNPVSLKSDIENNVSMYLIKPDWDKNIIWLDNGTFTTSSAEYVFPGNSNSTYYVMSAGASTTSRGLPSDINLIKWYEFSNNSYVFEEIVTGFETSFNKVKVERVKVSSNTSSTTYKFNVSGEGSYPLGRSALWVMVKAYNYEELKADIKSVEEINRYLRVR